MFAQGGFEKKGYFNLEMHFRISGECLIPNHFWVFVMLWDNPFKAKPCCTRLFLSSFPAASLRETEKFLPRLLHTLLQRLKIPEDFEPAQNSGFQTLPRLQESCREKHCKVILHYHKKIHRFEIEQNNITLHGNVPFAISPSSLLSIASWIILM